MRLRKPGASRYNLFMYSFTSSTIDLDQLRERLRKMNDAELLRFGKAAKYMCSPQANLNKPPRRSFVVQLEEAKAEWRRRKAKNE
jgi:hypothetical protein